MKLTKIALACTAALCGTQAHAVFVTPAQIAAIPSGQQIWISGASAQQKTLGKIAAGMLDNLTVVYDKPLSGTNGKNFRSYAGNLKAGSNAGFVDGTLVVIHNRALGGSVWGVNPVATGNPIDYMSVTGGNCVATGTPQTNTTGPHYTCNVTTVGNSVTAGGILQTSDAGVSDVEPKMFQGINVAAGDVALSDTQRAALSQGGSQYAVVFGPAVRKAGVTNLSRAQVNSILIGNYVNWSQVDPALTGAIKVCRRTNGSGTQAAYNAHFQGFACSLSPQVPVDKNFSVNVIENDTSGGVVSCLNSNDGSIGTLSLENVKGTSDLWDFVTLDGIDPKVSSNVIEGKYDFFVEQSIQWKASVPANKAGFLEAFKSRSGDPVVLAGLPGVYALPTVANPGDAGVINGTRFGDTCAALQLVYPFAP